MLFTVICYAMARPRWLLWILSKEPDETTSKFYNFSYKLLRPFYHDREESVSILLCGGAKTAALGVTLISSQYGDHNPHLGELLVPLVLYQGTQVLAAGFMTGLMKKWIHNGPTYLKKKAEKEEEERRKLEQKAEEEEKESQNKNLSASEEGRREEDDEDEVIKEDSGADTLNDSHSGRNVHNEV